MIGFEKVEIERYSFKNSSDELTMHSNDLRET
jgi:hypothetical protein